MRAQFLACYLLLAVPCIAVAGPPECGRITLAFYELGALYYHQPGGSWTGIDKEIVDELARRTGCQFLTRRESRVRIWEQLATGKLKMSVSGIPTPEREKFARFVPYFVTRNYALQMRSLPAQASTPEGFLAARQYTVAVVKSFKHGAMYDSWLDQLRVQGRVHEVADFRTVVRLLKLGRVQAVLALPTSWVPALRQEGIMAEVRVLDWSPKDRVIHGLILSRTGVTESMATRMSEAIQAMRDDGTLLSIFERHIGTEMADEVLNDGNSRAVQRRSEQTPSPSRPVKPTSRH